LLAELLQRPVVFDLRSRASPSVAWGPARAGRRCASAAIGGWRALLNLGGQSQRDLLLQRRDRSGSVTCSAGTAAGNTLIDAGGESFQQASNALMRWPRAAQGPRP